MTGNQPESRAGDDPVSFPPPRPHGEPNAAEPGVNLIPLNDGGRLITVWHEPGVEGAARYDDLALTEPEWHMLVGLIGEAA